MRAYYAHVMALYNTPQEARDVALLESLGYEVENPNTPEIQARANQLTRSERKEGVMTTVFQPLVAASDLLAFRALPDGSISLGVYREIGYALDLGIPVLELPSGLERRALTLRQTREYLREVGQQ